MGSLEDSIEQITKLPAPVILVITLWIAGLGLRLAKFPPNKYIPIILCFGGAVIYPLISSDERIGFTYADVKPMFYLHGFLLGAGAVAANEILRNIPIVGPFLEKIQNAFKASGSNGDTTITKKPENYENQIPPTNNPSAPK